MFMQYLRMRGAENNNFFGDSPIQPKEGRFYWNSVDDVRFVGLKVFSAGAMLALIFYSNEILNMNTKLSFDTNSATFPVKIHPSKIPSRAYTLRRKLCEKWFVYARGIILHFTSENVH